MSEYIGSRISLISKSDIKYIGTLHEINSDTHTVALESVTSYGTEGRKGDPAQEIPGSDQVYEYIVFRGSDVKELTIVAPPSAPKENLPPQVPNDPAILGSARPTSQAQSQLPPGQPSQQFHGPEPQFSNPPQFGYGAPQNRFQNESRFQGPGGPHGFPGTPGAVPNYGYPPPPPGYGMGYGPPLPGQGYAQPLPPHGGFAHGPQGSIGLPTSQSSQQRQSQPPVGSKQGTPQPAAQHAPPIDAQSKPAEMPAAPVTAATTIAGSGPPPPLDSKPVAAAAAAQSEAGGIRSNGRPKAGPKAAANRVAVPLPAGAIASKSLPKPAQAQPAAPTTVAAQPSQSAADATQAATAAVAAAMAKLGNTAPQHPAAIVDNLTEQVNVLRMQDGQHRGRGRGSRGGPRGGRRDPSQQKIDVPREDYDFESANAKFNKQDLVKEQIAGSPVPPASNGTGSDAAAATPAAALNGHGAEMEEVVISPPASTEKGYDKKSSFFDNISSDLKDRLERQDGVDGRAMRREERSRNVETFGQGSVDGAYRGSHRGRGGRGRGYSRGGPRGGFRGRGRGGPEVMSG